MITTRNKAPTDAKVLGAWTDLVLEKMYGSPGSKYCEFDVWLRREFQLAMDGNLRAIKTMLELLDANIKARDYLYPEAPKGVIWRGGRPSRNLEKEPRNADMALLILGICELGNEVVHHLRAKSEASYEEKLMALRPDMIAPWVQVAAKGASACEPRVAECSGEPKREAWNANKEALLADLMRLRGPGATRFKPGRSGNPKGRPRQKEKYPYEDFFMEVLPLKFGKRTVRVTRLDALIKRLASKAADEPKIRALLMPRLRKIKEMEWEANNVVPRERIIRD